VLTAGPIDCWKDWTVELTACTKHAWFQATVAFSGGRTHGSLETLRGCLQSEAHLERCGDRVNCRLTLVCGGSVRVGTQLLKAPSLRIQIGTVAPSRALPLLGFMCKAASVLTVAGGVVPMGVPGLKNSVPAGGHVKVDSVTPGYCKIESMKPLLMLHICSQIHASPH